MDFVWAAEQANVAFDRWVLALAPTLESVDTPENFYAATGVPIPLANRVIRTQWDDALLPEQVAAKIQQVVAWFAARNVPLLWDVWPSTRPTTLPAALAAAGLIGRDEGPVMTLDFAALPDVEPPAGADIRVINDDERFSTWIETMAASFAFSPEDLEMYRFLGRAIGYRAPVRQIFATLDGEPAGTATIFFQGELALLMNVGTMPNARRKGLGAAVTVAALREARASGATTGVLQASEMGEPVYRRLGFTEQCRKISYIWMPPANGDEQ